MNEFKAPRPGYQETSVPAPALDFIEYAASVCSIIYEVREQTQWAVDTGTHAMLSTGLCIHRELSGLEGGVGWGKSWAGRPQVSCPSSNIPPRL